MQMPQIIPGITLQLTSHDLEPNAEAAKSCSCDAFTALLQAGLTISAAGTAAPPRKAKNPAERPGFFAYFGC